MANLLKIKKSTEDTVNIPKELPILPLRNTVAFPFSIIPLAVGIARSVRLVEEALQGERLVGLVAMKDSSIEEPKPGQVYETGTVAKIHQVHRSPDKSLQVIVEGLERFRIENWTETEPYLRARIALAPLVSEEGVELDALVRSLRDLSREVIELSPNLPDEASTLLNQVQDPRYLAYLVASNARLQVTEGQKILEMDDIRDKLRALISHLTHEKEVLSLGQKIQTEAREEMDKAQREYYLRQQLKAIQKELGEKDEGQSAFTEYTEKIEQADIPQEEKKQPNR
jgi:ATP-dependent Lon protease